MVSAQPRTSLSQTLECPNCKTPIRHMPSRSVQRATRLCPKCGSTVAVQQPISNVE